MSFTSCFLRRIVARHLATANVVRCGMSVIALDKQLEFDFERYCVVNSRILSLVHKSSVGEVQCPPGAVDIRRTLQKWTILKDQNITEHSGPLTEHPWDSLVTFYLASSSHLEALLQTAGMATQHSGHCPVYLTDIEMLPVGPFNGKLLVTMHPMASKLVAEAVERMTAVGFAPVHIGDPSCMGISDLQVPHSGLPVYLKDDDVPVFWPSSLTAQLAVQFARPSLAYIGNWNGFSSEKPAIASFSSQQIFPVHLVKLHKEGRRCISSVVSNPILGAITRLEDCLVAGSWRKGVKELQQFSRGSLLQAAASLSHSRHVAITTGFPCHMHRIPPDETDGPPGILAIVRSLIACGKQVTIITDQRVSFLRKTIEQALKKYVPQSQDVAVISYPPVHTNTADMITAKEFLFDQSTGKIRFDHLVALERAGPNYEGRYLTMTAKDVSHLCDPVDQLFTLACETNIKTIAVGDGGNEVGFGKLCDKVAQFVDNGDKIACVVPADHLIVSGVSNWGGYAIAAALYLLRRCPLHVPYVKRGICSEPVRLDAPLDEFMPSVKEERELLSFLMDAGLRDGILPNQMMSVDGRTFDDCHAVKIREIWKLAGTD